MTSPFSQVVGLLGLAGCLLASAGPASAEPMLKAGDRMIFLGDGITYQRIFTRYTMNIFDSHYPGTVFSFRNAGLVGDDECDRSPGGLKRLQRDVLDHQPTWVCVAFGMNDPRYKAFDQTVYEEYMAGLTGIVNELKQRKVRVVLMTPGCVDASFQRNGIDGKIYNDVLRQYADGVKALAARENLPVADVHAVLAGMIEKAPSLVGEPTQPSAVVHAAMAFALARALGCEGPVSDAVIDGKAGRLDSAVGCKVSKLKVSSNSVSFVRSDKALPAYLDPDALPVYGMYLNKAQNNRYGLMVKGLAEGQWQLTVEGTNVLAVFSAAQLAEGVNLAGTPGPWHTLGARINGMNAALEDMCNSFWWDVKTAKNWWLPAEAEAERIALEIKVMKVMADRDKAIAKVATEIRPWQWTLTKNSGL
jgi:lysophospholipase L1-like esterase